MVEAKYRAWDKNLEKMFDVQSYDWKNNIAWATKPAEGHSIIKPILMQWTGRNDKNGKELFDGDIVIWKQAAGGLLPPTGNEYICQIIWDRAMSRWACQEIKAIKDDYHSSFTLAPEHIKIIGNIYENAELLK